MLCCVIENGEPSPEERWSTKSTAKAWGVIGAQSLSTEGTSKGRWWFLVTQRYWGWGCGTWLLFFTFFPFQKCQSPQKHLAVRTAHFHALNLAAYTIVLKKSIGVTRQKGMCVWGVCVYMGVCGVCVCMCLVSPSFYPCFPCSLIQRKGPLWFSLIDRMQPCGHGKIDCQALFQHARC